MISNNNVYTNFLCHSIKHSILLEKIIYEQIDAILKEHNVESIDINNIRNLFLFMFDKNYTNEKFNNLFNSKKELNTLGMQIKENILKMIEHQSEIMYFYGIQNKKLANLNNGIVSFSKFWNNFDKKKISKNIK